MNYDQFIINLLTQFPNYGPNVKRYPKHNLDDQQNEQNEQDYTPGIHVLNRF